MVDKIEFNLMSRKYYLTMIIIVIVIIFIQVNAIYNDIELDLFFIIQSVMFDIIYFLIWWFLFLNTPSRIILESNNLYIEKLFTKSMTLQLEDVITIRKTGFQERKWGGGGKSFYEIKYDKRKIILNPIIFDIAGINFEQAIIQLKYAVNTAKMG